MIFRNIFVLLILVSCNQDIWGQKLVNSEWTRIRSERKDGSRIVDRSNSLKARLIHSPISYSFYESTVKISYDGEYSTEYKVFGDTLIIGYYIEGPQLVKTAFAQAEVFKIDTLSNLFLILSELSFEKLPDDKINRFYFVNRKRYFDYLKNENKVHFINDTIIGCNRLLFPYYNESNIDLLLTRELSPRTIKSTMVKGQLLFNSNGGIEEVKIDDNGELSEGQTLKLKKVLWSTSGSWTVPQTYQDYYFNMHFACKYQNDGIGSTVSISYNINDSTRNNLTQLTSEQIAKVNRFYNKGVRFFEGNEFEKAILEFSKCLEIDSYHIDSMYNLAYCYYKLNMKKKSCMFWKKLKDLDQAQGGNLYDENCH
jgi:tetratricopeptide (TPR) repeat protein